MPVTLEQALAAKERAKVELAPWLTIISSFGLTKAGEDWAVSVNLTQETPADHKLPERIQGVPVVVDVVGGVSAYRR